jgi:hypothetical protein
VGLWLLLSRPLLKGERFLLAWALLPVLGNFFYWHHGFHLGPRMLYEAAPAWIILAAGAALTLTTPTGRLHGGLSRPGNPHPGEKERERRGFPRSHRLADLALWSLLVSLPAAGLLVVNRAAAYQWTTETLARVSPPEPGGDPPALVFVHGSWSERISARLQASGMRLDRIETAIRRNDICLLHTFATARGTGREGASRMGPGLSDLDLQRVAESPSFLVPAYLSEGNRVLVDPRRPFSPECRREAQADRNGIISLAPLLWQGDLPGAEVGRPMFVRDLGPEENAPILERFPNRRPYLFTMPSPSAAPVLLDYREGMEIVWGGAPS